MPQKIPDMVCPKCGGELAVKYGQRRCQSCYLKVQTDNTRTRPVR